MPDLHRALEPVEQRVLGCLVEKELSTPDSYPLSGNALLAACNQTTNREPVLSLTAEQVDHALHTLMADLLVWRERGARVLRWKHLVDEKLGLDVPGKAVLAELLLRGPQTPGELRGRSQRLHAFGGLGEVEGVLTELAARGLVAELPRQPGQKERRWRHLMGQQRSGGHAAAAAEPGERRLHVEPARGAAGGHGPAAAPGAPAPAGGTAASAAAAGSATTAGTAQPSRGLEAPHSVGSRPGIRADGPTAAPPRLPTGATSVAPAASAAPPPTAPLERRVAQLEQRLAEVLARLARLEEGTP